ncbi:ribosomal protein S12 methylthiotransferase accessory factor [Friedmanniella endophytica]|uniref:Ribosomal protein S12 methylthiotransferase accessory factor n=1 Tax=Microlunatus kandeliicorticis TaxID=1759536 RepID=A0A7W3INZ4_9ACTN|nr:YcaO-like family protein [Microlunatus kandeliicorticis]MBA8792557.1 ribosomal protein S12 methylthiotransferase accessory factor [Microlunatus kandeliicorticis]
MTHADEAYRETLARFGTVIDFDLSSLDRTGVPVTSCSLAVDGRFAHHGNGYGATDQAARVSGLGELTEGVLGAQTVRGLEPETGSRRELVGRYGAGAVVDPRLLCLPAGADYDDDQPVSWVVATRLRDDAPVRVPLAFVASEPDELAADRGRSLITPITNGLGAGLDRDRAIAHGIGEIIQRHTNGLRFRALDARSPVIATDTLPAPVRELVDRFAGLGITVVVKYAGTAFGSFSCYAMGLDDELADPIRLTAGGEAADPSPERALTKAVLEYANSRARKAFCFGSNLSAVRAVAPAAYWEALPPSRGEPRAVEAMRAWAELPAERLRALTAPDLSRTVSFAEVAGDPAPAPASVADWVARLEGREAYAVTGEVDGVWYAKTMITGAEVETLSYGRIGEDNARVSLEGDLDLVRVQDTPTGDHRARVALTAEAEERLGGPVWFSPARAAEIVGPLYPLYREPPRHSVAVGAAAAGREVRA